MQEAVKKAGTCRSWTLKPPETDLHWQWIQSVNSPLNIFQFLHEIYMEPEKVQKLLHPGSLCGEMLSRREKEEVALRSGTPNTRTLFQKFPSLQMLIQSLSLSIPLSPACMVPQFRWLAGCLRTLLQPAQNRKTPWVQVIFQVLRTITKHHKPSSVHFGTCWNDSLPVPRQKSFLYTMHLIVVLKGCAESICPSSQEPHSQCWSTRCIQPAHCSAESFTSLLTFSTYSATITISVQTDKLILARQESASSDAYSELCFAPS